MIIAISPAIKPSNLNSNSRPLGPPVNLVPVGLFPNNPASVSRDPDGGVAAVFVSAGVVAGGYSALGVVTAAFDRKPMWTTRVIVRTRCICALGKLGMAEFNIESRR